MFKKNSLPQLIIGLFLITFAACGATASSSEAAVNPPASPPASQVSDSLPTVVSSPEPLPETDSPAEAPSMGISTAAVPAAAGVTYPIVDTGQTNCFSESEVIPCGQAYNGQDAQYEGLQPAYRDNGDGTVTDLNTGLMWVRDPGEKTYYYEALEKLENYSFAGYDDWRLPTIQELYSLALFNGVDASAATSSYVDGLVPFIETDYLAFLYGDESGGNRVIDAQWLSSTVYNSTVMDGTNCFLGFNFSGGG